MDQLPRFGKRELVCLLLFTCNYVVSVLLFCCCFCCVFFFFFFFWGGGEVPLPLGAWDGLRYFIVALPEPSI